VYGGLLPFGSTFLNFISYGLGAVRLAALSRLRVLYIMTHDSIGLGEDGPTHQPVETLVGLRATPHVMVWRPADGNEVSAAYQDAIEDSTRPAVLALTRQNLPQLAGSSIAKALTGGYTVHDCEGDAQVILVGTGSEVSLCIDAAKLVHEQYQVRARVVSMPCWKKFDRNSNDYKREVFPLGVPVMSVEALSTVGWERYAHASVGMRSFGSSAPASKLFEFFGLTKESVAEKASKLVDWYTERPVADLIEKPF
jgi:transketolase